MPPLKPPRWSWNVASLEPQFRSISRGLSVVIPLWEGNAEDQVAYTSQGILQNTFNTSGTWVLTKYGPAWLVDGTSGHRLEWGPSHVFSGDPATGATYLLVVVNENATNARFHWSLDGTGDSHAKIVNSTSYQISFNGIGGSNVTTPNLFGIGDSQIFVTTIDAVRAATTHWNIEGEIGSGVHTYTANIAPSADAPVLQLSVSGTAGGRADGRYVMWAKWDRSLSDTEIQQVLADPFGLLRPALLETETVTGQDIVPAALTVTATAGTVVITTGSVPITPAALTVTVTPSTVRIADGIIPAPLTVTATPGTATVTTKTPIVPAAVTVTVSEGTMTITTGSVPITPAALTVTATPSGLAITTGSVPITPAALTVTVSAGTMTVTTSTPVVPDPLTVIATPGTVTVSIGQPVTPASLTVNATAGTMTVTTGSVPIVPASLTVNATPGTFTVTTETPIVPAAITVTITAGTVTITTGSVPIIPDPATVTATAGTVVVTAPAITTQGFASITDSGAQDAVAVTVSGAAITDSGTGVSITDG